MIEEIERTTPNNLAELKDKIAERWENDGEKIIKEIENFTAEIL